MGAVEVVPFLVFGIGLPVLGTAITLFILYWIIRKAVAAGIRDSRGAVGHEQPVTPRTADGAS